MVECFAELFPGPVSVYSMSILVTIWIIRWEERFLTAVDSNAQLHGIIVAEFTTARWVWILWGVENCRLPLTKPVAVNTGLALPRSPWFYWYTLLTQHCRLLVVYTHCACLKNVAKSHTRLQSSIALLMLLYCYVYRIMSYSWQNIPQLHN